MQQHLCSVASVDDGAVGKLRATYNAEHILQKYRIDCKYAVDVISDNGLLHIAGKLSRTRIIGRHRNIAHRVSERVESGQAPSGREQVCLFIGDGKRAQGLFHHVDFDKIAQFELTVSH